MRTRYAYRRVSVTPPAFAAVSGRAGDEVPWSDAAGITADQPAALSAWLAVADDVAAEVVLEGACPRCGHPLTSTHPVRALAGMFGGRGTAADPYWRLLTVQCTCAHEHQGAPTGTGGCGAAFTVWMAWTQDMLNGRPRVELDARLGPRATLAGLQEERALEAARLTQLADVRKAAENWRTGLAGLLAILGAVFFLKGRSSFTEIHSTAVKVTLAALLLASALAAVYGAYRALRAAYGIPSDEFTGNEGSALMRSVRRSPWFADRFRTPDNPTRYATVGAWRSAFARLAVGDLRQAKLATLVSLAAFSAAAAITWFAA